MNDLWEGFLVDPKREYQDGDINLSQTSINNAQLCGGKLLYRDSPLYNHVPSEAMSFGSMVHGMNELDLGVDLMLLEFIDPWSPAEVEKMWAESLLNERDGSFDLYSLASRARIDKSVAEAIHANSEWRQWVLPTLKLSDNLLVEKRVTKCIGVLPDGRAVWLGGTADLVDLDHRMIYDWKTSGKQWDQSKADAGNQASIYTYLYDDIPDHEYHVYSRKDGEWGTYATSRTPEQVDAAVRLAWQTAKGMASGSLIVNPWASNWGKYKRAWYCSARWCAAWDACEMKSINDNVYEEQAIEIKEGWG